MLWRKNKGIAALALLVAALTLAGCGFRPLYGEQANSPATTQYMAAVEIAPIPERIGQELQNHLRVRLNPRGAPANTRYRLQTRLNEIRTDLAIRDDASATLANLQLIANYTLLCSIRGRAASPRATIWCARNSPIWWPRMMREAVPLKRSATICACALASISTARQKPRTRGRTGG